MIAVGAIPGSVQIVEHVPDAFANWCASHPFESFAISGGDTARRCYEQLAVTNNIAWETIEVYISDERWVPVDDGDSNEGMARFACLDGVRPKAIHSLRHAAGGHGDIHAAADAYDALLRERLPVDVVHLGFGGDGHTASLFPNSPACQVTDRYVVATGDDLHPWPRLTWTFPAI
ncbi:MAG: 6-phosphogluconolactonase, partial [Acidimicrobiia bacterium]